MSFKKFSSYDHFKRNEQRSNFEEMMRNDDKPSRVRGHHTFMNRADREKWHLKVIADFEANRAGRKVEHR